MEFVRDFLKFVEDHPGLFTGLCAIVSALAAVGGMVLQYYRNRKRREQLDEELRTSRDREKSLVAEVGGLKSSLAHVGADLAKAENKTRDVEERLDVEKIQHEVDVNYQKEERNKVIRHFQDKLKKREVELQAIIAGDRAELEKHQKQQKRWENVLHRTIKAEGEFFANKTRCGIPKFRPLQDRRTAVVSVLNLKGGVGKTTVTAHLGAAFAAKGYRVLLIDLDLQGSLSSVYLTHRDISAKSEEKRLLQHYFGHLSQGKTPKLGHFVQPILPGTKSGLIATSDKLSYSEINLTLTWQLRLGSKKDSRFFLRKALHLRQILNRYDIILIDCPPLVNSCCTNALAASDYVLVPVTLSQSSIDRVPKLIKTIKAFNHQVNPNLQILGAVANRTWGTQLTGEEQLLWNMMANQAKDQLGSPLHRFETLIRNSKEVREAEDADDVAFVPPIPGSVLFDTFRRLACEMEERLPLECRRTFTAPQQLEPLAS